MHWAPGPIWAGRTVVVAAGGPSFDAPAARLIGIARARSKVKVVAVNDAVYPCWFADIAWASDPPWWRHHVNLPGFEGRRLGLRYQDGSQWRQPAGIDHLEASGIDGFDDRPGYVRHGGNGGYAATHLAAQLGAIRIVLVGFDMSGEHWFGRHPEGLHRPSVDKTKWVTRFNGLAETLKARGVAVTNTSQASALSCFPKASLDAVL